MIDKIKKHYEQDKSKFIKQAAAGAGASVVAVTAFPYVVAGAGLALGFWLGRKAVGEIKI